MAGYCGYCGYSVDTAECYCMGYDTAADAVDTVDTYYMATTIATVNDYEDNYGYGYGYDHH